MPLSGVLERFYNYWYSLPKVADSLLPTKFDMLPTDLLEAMPRLTLLKRISRYQVNVCLIRTTSNSMWHAPFVGMNAFDLIAPAMRENSAKFYTAVLDWPCGAVITEEVAGRNGKPRFASSLYLPLANSSGSASYIAGCSVYQQRANYKNTNDRMLPNHEQVLSVTFLDIGAGIPNLTFEAKHTQPQQQQLSQQWWSRFMPTRMRSEHYSRPNNIVSTPINSDARWQTNSPSHDNDRNIDV